ncbi:MAG: hypothetical protein LEGION0403_FIIPPAGN_02266 [Legionella sp.]
MFNDAQLGLYETSKDFGYVSCYFVHIVFCWDLLGS